MESILPSLFSQMKTEDESLCKGTQFFTRERKSIRPILPQVLCMLNISLTEIAPFYPVLWRSAQPLSQLAADTRGQVSLCPQTHKDSRQQLRRDRPISRLLICYCTSSNDYSEYQISFSHMTFTFRQEQKSLSQRKKKSEHLLETLCEGPTAFCCSQTSTVLITKPTKDTNLLTLQQNTYHN